MSTHVRSSIELQCVTTNASEYRYGCNGSVECVADSKNRVHEFEPS